MTTGLIKMKVIVRHNIAPLTKYPFIGICELNQCVVYFVEPQSGICLQKGYTDNVEGEYLSNWAMIRFNAFKGTITLENDL